MGRTRVLILIDDMDDIAEFLTALTPDTPDTVWQAHIQVRDDIPARLQTRLAESGRDDDAGDLAPLGATANRPHPTTTTPGPATAGRFPHPAL